MLAASHAIGTNAYIDYEVASFLADILLRRYSGALISRYEFAKDSIAGLDGFGVIEAIAQKRGFLMKARKGVAVGELDIDKAAKTLLVDYRTGHLGRVTLERP